jgi:NAD(P)-dependent dehydrogenase (short-subunit alcohol dehydrogenase family)
MIELFSNSGGSSSSNSSMALVGSMTTSAVVVGTAAVAAAALLVRRRRTTAVAQHPPEQSAILITGGSRGIGRSTADYLVRRGYTVIVTVRTQAQCDELLAASSSRLFPVILDVTNDSHVAPAVQRVQAILDAQKNNLSLVAIVNNAGINPEADEFPRLRAAGQPIENKLAEPAVALRVLETNVVGVARVTRAFLPLLPTTTSSSSEAGGGGSGGGRIVNIGSYFGSIAGKVGLAHAYYEASKFALEGLSDNMRRSLSSQGIMVSLIKPGNISTDMNSIGEVGPEVVARDIEHAIAARHPLPRYYPGKVKGLPTRLPCWMFEMLPTWLTDKL